MKHRNVIIVGGGLAGLYAAYLLQQRQIPYILLETQPRLGGRILGTQNKKDTSHYFDLGPTWVFPHHGKIQRLIKQLGMSLFEQHTTGDVLFQSIQRQPPNRIKAADVLQLFKVQGGTYSLICALRSTLDQNCIHLDHEMTKIEKHKDLWHLTARHKGSEYTFRADQLMLAMPPRIMAKYLTHKQWISNSLLTNLQNSQTWMAAQAKFVVAYDKPFWREQGLSGQLFSQTGPMVEVYDASTDTNAHHGLFGFIGWPASRRSQMTQQQLKDACLTQLIACYGPRASDFSECYLKDWATDEFTCTASYRFEASRHPEFILSNHLHELNSLKLHLIGSEFAHIEPGYLEGAIDAVDRSALFSSN